MPTMNAKVDDFLGQKRIAVAGVSRGGKSPANLIYEKLKREGHIVYAINPNTDSFDGEPVYADVKSTPEKPDGVVIVTNPALTEQIMKQCADAGIPRAWIHSSVVHGSSVTESAIQYGESHGVNVIPGGCPMMFGPTADFAHKGMCWWMQLTGSLPK